MEVMALTVMTKPALTEAKSWVVFATHEWFGIEARPKMARIESRPELTNSALRSKMLTSKSLTRKMPDKISTVLRSSSERLGFKSSR